MCKRVTTLVAVGLAGGLLLCVTAVHGAVSTDPQKFAQIEKGRYLATVADCAGCHTIPERGKPFAGGRAIETPFGDIISANITPDRETGIGNWSDDDFDKAVRKGIRSDGSRLYPAMPYTAYTKMSRDDVMAIRAYLNTVAPVHTETPPNLLPFPLNIRAGMWVWNLLYFTEGEFKSDPQKSAEWNRGAFLVQGPGHCGACHTSKSFLGGDKTSEYLRGSYLQGWFAPNITNDQRRGLGGWSVDDIATYLKNGHNRITAATGPMAEEITLASSHMTDGDLKAIATYLKSVPGEQGGPIAVHADDPAMKAGQAIYRDTCSACHGLDGHGVAELFPSLAESSMVRSDDPTTLIRIILRGARSAATKQEPTSPGMPSFGRQLDDAQIAAVLTYVRNNWGAASAISSPDVGHARKDLGPRTD
jgi:mono/diheme cytochrome c family protein